MKANNSLLLGWQEYLVKYYFSSEDALSTAESQEIYELLAEIRLAYDRSFEGGPISLDVGSRILDILSCYLETNLNRLGNSKKDLMHIVGRTVIELHRIVDEVDIRLPYNK